MTPGVRKELERLLRQHEEASYRWLRFPSLDSESQIVAARSALIAFVDRLAEKGEK